MPTANDLLVKRLTSHGYHPVQHTHGLWKHKTRLITFTLVVNEFGRTYVGEKHVDHLLNALKQHYEVTEDWEGKFHCGILVTWDYNNKTVDLSMPGYIESTLQKIQHKPNSSSH
jgi:hypothetical protein